MTLLLSTTGAFFLDNWGELLIALLAFSKVVVNLTPTETDNRVFGYLDTLINTRSSRTESRIVNKVAQLLSGLDLTQAFKTKGDLKRWSAKRTIG